MALPVREQLKYWGIATAVFLVLLWYLGDVLLPFVLGGAIAYFLDPVADRLERAGCSRAVATAIITVAAVLVFVVMALLVIPTLVQQTIELVNTVPQLMAQLRDFLLTQYPEVVEPDSTIRRSLDQIAEAVQSRGLEYLNRALASVGSLLNIVLLFVIVPVVAVYLLLDWDKLIAEIDRLLPRDHAPVIRRLAAEIDRTLSGFLRGMGTVCLILGTYYAVALMAVGLQFGLVVGFVAGLLTFIPYVGAIVGGMMAIGLALFQFWGDWFWILLVAAIFQFGQIMEGNIITPRLVGNSVGLHPVWLLLALTVFGSLFGFVGMLVAVPVAAAIGVVARFGVGQYLGSRLYRGLENPDEE
jgi:predicted PurR-regulated permease PerM